MKKKTPKNNSTNKDIVAEIEERFKRHTGVLMEQMQKEVRTVAEGHSGIMRKLDEHDDRFAKIESEVGSLQSEVGSLRSEVGSLRSEVGSVKSELQYVKAAVMDTNQTAKSIEKKLDNHETRISKLEEKIHA